MICAVENVAKTCWAMNMSYYNLLKRNQSNSVQNPANMGIQSEYIYIHNGNITNNVFFCRFYPTCPPIILSESEFRDSAPHGWSFWRNSSIVPHSKNKKHSFENCSILTVAYLAFFYFQLWSHIQLSTVHLDQIRKYCFFTHLKHPPMDTPNWVFIGLFENKVPHNSMVYYHVSIQRDYFGVYHGIQLRPFTSYKCL